MFCLYYYRKELTIDTENVNPEMVQEALKLTTDNIEEFEKKWKINFREELEPKFVFTPKKDISIKELKIINEIEEQKKIKNYIEKKVLTYEAIGIIKFESAGCGFYNGDSISFSGIAEYIVEKEKLAILMSEVLPNTEYKDVVDVVELMYEEMLSYDERMLLSQKYLEKYYHINEEFLNNDSWEEYNADYHILDWIIELNSTTYREEKDTRKHEDAYTRIDTYTTEIILK